MAETVTPGSVRAIELGCTCPVMDNCHGRGFSKDDKGNPLFWINPMCPLHGVKINDKTDE